MACLDNFIRRCKIVYYNIHRETFEMETNCIRTVGLLSGSKTIQLPVENNDIIITIRNPNKETMEIVNLLNKMKKT